MDEDLEVEKLLEEEMEKIRKKTDKRVKEGGGKVCAGLCVCEDECVCEGVA